MEKLKSFVVLLVFSFSFEYVRNFDSNFTISGYYTEKSRKEQKHKHQLNLI